MKGSTSISAQKVDEALEDLQEVSGAPVLCRPGFG